MAKKDREKIKKAQARKAKAVAKAKAEAKAKSSAPQPAEQTFGNPATSQRGGGQDTLGGPLMPRRSKKG